MDRCILIEELLGGFSIATTTAGVLAQIDPAMGAGIVGIVTQFGGLGLAVWLVYYHTTVTVPKMQEEYKSERLAMALQHKLEMDEKRKDYFEHINKLAAQHHADLDQRRVEVLNAIRQLPCTKEAN